MRTLLVTLHSKYIHASLALPYLAAACAADCGELAIREFTVHEPKEQLLAALLAEGPEVVAFSVYLWNRRETLELVDALAVAAPGTRLVLGGPEVISEGPALFDRHPGLTALIVGEGEEPLRRLLAAWYKGEEPDAIPRLLLRRRDGTLAVGPATPPAFDLDLIPSPFAAKLVDLTRGLVYYETSRGCPYTCAFCLSARDASVRSFSPERIENDLLTLMDAGVPLIKLVDRTFNYDAARARRIWRFILAHNRGSRFHFEIGAHLLDAESLALLASVPAGLFQFEIGVQSTLPATLAAVSRRADLARLEENVCALRAAGNIPLHLDLIFGLPGEGYDDFLASLDRVAALMPDHLQIEPVKLLPGSPLRDDAAALGLAFDPHPPYTVLATPLLCFSEIERLRGIGRLLDLLVNSGRFVGTLAELVPECGGLGRTLERLEGAWRQAGLFRRPLGAREVAEQLATILATNFAPPLRERLLDLLGRDLARSERIALSHAPVWLDTRLSAVEDEQVKEQVRRETAAIRGQGIKLQHFAARFPQLDGAAPLRLFLYFTAPGAGLTVRELVLVGGEWREDEEPVKRGNAGKD